MKKRRFRRSRDEQPFSPKVSNQLTILKRPSLLNACTVWGLLFFLAFIYALQVAGVFNRELINVGGWNLVWRFLVAALSPDFSPEFLYLTLDATIKTLSFAGCGTTFSLLIGFFGGVLSSQIWWISFSPVTSHQSPVNNKAWLIVRAFLATPRAIHELIWGLFFINIFGLDPLVAILAIAIPFGAITAKVFSEILDETPRQPLLALLNSGVPPLNAFAYSLIPQAFTNLLSYSFYRFECSIRAAAVLGIIGAGGLGYQMMLSLQSLKYEQVWTLLIALVLLNGATDFWSATLRRRLGAPSRIDINMQKASKPKKLIYERDLIVQLSFVAVILAIPFCFWYINADFSKLWQPRTAQLLAGVLKDAFPPDFSQISTLLSESLQTIAMSILAMVGAGLGGILLSFPAANKSPVKKENFNKYWRVSLLLFTRIILLVARAVPEPIWALLLLFVLFPGILPGAIALGLHNFGILGRLMAEVIENLDERPMRSLQALGASNSQVFLYSILPITLPRFIAYILYRWEVCIRTTVIVGLVGAGGLGRILTEQLSSFDYKGLLTTLIIFLAITFVVDMISASIRKTLR